jgi:hypothetical protein
MSTRLGTQASAPSCSGARRIPALCTARKPGASSVFLPVSTCGTWARNALEREVLRCMGARRRRGSLIYNATLELVALGARACRSGLSTLLGTTPGPTHAHRACSTRTATSFS